MMVQVVIENGVKKFIPLTADAGAGNPVGSLLHTYKKSNPSGYLYCDGSTFDQTKYPLLYAYLGSNVLPDYRECVEVGAEQNTTDTIATHDVYTEGQFKDDQLQNHTHNLSLSEDGDYKLSRGYTTGGNQRYSLPDSMTDDDYPLWASTIYNGRHGTTTHGKQKAVFVYIKATSGLTEGQQDNVVAQINTQRSYSTEEVNTGKTWIDGKPIYRKVLTATLQTNEEVLNLTVSHQLQSLVSVKGLLSKGNVDFVIPYCFIDGSYIFQIYTYCQGSNLFVIPRSSDGTYFNAGCVVRMIVEYTKTN